MMRSYMKTIGDLLSEGIFSAKVGPTLMKKELNPFDIFNLSEVISSLMINLEQDEVDFLLFITSFNIDQDFFMLYLLSSSNFEK